MRPIPLYSRARAYHANESAFSLDVIWRRTSSRLLLFMRCQLLQYTNVREISIRLALIETVAYDEAIFDGEPKVVDRNRGARARRLVQERTYLDGARKTGAQKLEEVGDRETRIDDVLDEEHVFAFDGVPQILGNLHDAAR